MVFRPAAGLAALRHRDYACYLGANFLSTVALQIQAVALGWQIYDLTGDPFKLGLVGLMEFLPAMGLALVAGPIADHFDRRKILIIGYLAEMLAAVLLVLMVLTDRTSVFAILAIALLFGVVRALVAPAARAMLPSLVPKEVFSTAIAWNSTTWQVATIGGPALGGFLYVLGPDVAYAGTVVALIGGTVFALVMRGRKIAAKTEERPNLAMLLAGFPAIFRRPILLGALSLDLFAVLFSGAVALLPIFAKDVLHVGPDGLGILRSAPAIGAVTTALFLTQWPLRRHVGRRLFTAVGIFGVAVVGFGFSRDFWLSFGLLVLLGMADMVSVYVRGSIVPLATPDALRGRVMAVEMVFIGASNELGAFVAGTGAALLGAVPAVIVGGSMTILVTLAWARLFPPLRDVDRIESVAPDFRPEGGEDRIATG
jgi:MFS family permease